MKMINGLDLPILMLFVDENKFQGGFEDVYAVVIKP